MEDMNIEETGILESMDVISDFQKRANNFEERSQWVTDKIINNIPFEFLSFRKDLGDIFDAGGGTGYLSYYLISKMPATSVTIVDASINMLQKARERLPEAVTVNGTIESYCRMNNRKFDTILARQIFHYVDNTNLIIRLLRDKLKDNGILYVGQFVVHDEETSVWNNLLMKEISKSRRRSFIINDFIDLFLQNGFKVLEFCTTNYQDNLKDFYKRRTNNECSYEILLKNMTEAVNENIKKKMDLKLIDDNMFFSYQFCHLALVKEYYNMV